MRATEFLTESPLTPANLFDPRHLKWRPNHFLKKISSRTPFIDKDGNQYYPSGTDLNQLMQKIVDLFEKLKENPNAPLPSLSVDIEKIITKDGQELPGKLIPVSKFEKADLQTAKGQVTADVNVQPIGIGIATDPVNKPGTKPKDKVVLTTDEEVKNALDAHKEIIASNLYNVIIANQTLDQAGELGVAIKAVAKQMQEGKIPDLKQYDEATQKKIAIDAGEYLGILAMVNNLAEFPKQDRFLKFLGATDFKNLALIFPGEQNASLSDSYGVQNASTGHTIMISSKGGKGSTASGAAPALSGLAPSIQKRIGRIRKGDALDFINSIIQVKPVAVQGFAGINWLATYYPDLLPEQYRALTPFYSEDVRQILKNINTKGAEPMPEKFQSLISSPSIQQSKGTDGGKLAYVVTKDLVSIINESELINKFRKTVLELLDENFIQIFSRIVGGKLTTKVLWPGKVDGNVSLHTKMSPGSPGDAGLSFKVTD
jgi:hypothetical protein